jgi:zona occludens toxin (predicted ATPase)
VTAPVQFRFDPCCYTMTFVMKSQLLSLPSLAARSSPAAAAAAAASRISAAVTKRTMAAAAAPTAAPTDLVKTSLYDLHKGAYRRLD